MMVVEIRQPVCVSRNPVSMYLEYSDEYSRFWEGGTSQLRYMFVWLPVVSKRVLQYQMSILSPESQATTVGVGCSSSNDKSLRSITRKCDDFIFQDSIYQGGAREIPQFGLSSPAHNHHRHQAPFWGGPCRQWQPSSAIVIVDVNAWSLSVHPEHTSTDTFCVIFET